MGRPKGLKHTEETKQKMRDARNDEWREKQRASQAGDKHWRYGKLSTPFGHEVETKRREVERNAVKRGLEWTLTDDQARELVLADCSYCGKPSKLAEDRTTLQNTRGLGGIDRIDSSVGYVIGNVVACCGRCNVGKWSDSHEDFVAWIRLVHSHLC